jgi:hypothetical protein
MSKAEQTMHQVSLDLAKTLGVIRGVEQALIDSQREPFSDLGLALQVAANDLERSIIALDTA